MNRRILPVFVPHLGCPCRCVFCSQGTIAGQTAVPSGQEVARRIAEGAAACGSPLEVAFYGGSFTAVDWATQRELLEAVQPFLRAGLVSGIRVSTRPDAIDGEILARLAAYQVGMVELGAQSFCDEVLLAAKRGHTAEDIRNAARQIREQGIALGLQLMAGLPEDSRERCVRSAREAAALRPDGVRIYPVAVLPDTELAAMYRSGAYTPLTVEAAADVCGDMLEVFLEEQIPVFRVGLHPTEALAAAVIAGAYHPAMGERSYSAMYLKKMRALLPAALSPGKTVVFFVHFSEVSKAVGQRRDNLRRLAAEYPGVSFAVRKGSLPKGRVEAEIC